MNVRKPSLRRRSSARPAAVSFESLEKRQLLAVAMEYDASQRILILGGDAADDYVEISEVSRTDRRLMVKTRGPNGIETRIVDSPVDRIVFRGGAGNDTFINNTGIACSVHGETGNDILIGGSGNDFITGREGNDIVSGREGNDQLYGYTGDDLISGDAGDDYVGGYDGNDQLLGGDGNDALWAGKGNDSLRGEAGNDHLEGQEGDDRLEGGAGNDLLYGWTGNDVIYGGDGADFLSGYDGTDTLFGGKGDDALWAGLGDDFLYGEDGNDHLEGQAGNDQLAGGTGNDLLYGWTGNDRLFGEAGNDYLSGYDGADQLVGGDGADNLDGGSGIDHAWGEGGFDRYRLVTAHVPTGTGNWEYTLNVESGTFAEAPYGSPQQDEWSCGPNSAWRMLQHYGKNVSLSVVKLTARLHWIPANFGVGLTALRLRDVIRFHGVEATAREESNLDSMLGELAKGKPVIALLQVGTTTDSVQIGGVTLGTSTRPDLHWVLVNGFDATSKTIFYTDTDGKQYSASYTNFSKMWNWNPNSFNSVVRTALRASGLKSRSFIM